MIIEKIIDFVHQAIKVIDAGIRTNYKESKKINSKDILLKANNIEMEKMEYNKILFEKLLNCLDPNSNSYSCFTAISPIMKKLDANKEDWLEVIGFLLSKARRIENDYTIVSRYTDFVSKKATTSAKKSIAMIDEWCKDASNMETLKDKNGLKKIVDENGNFLPHELNNYERFLLIAVGMNEDQVSLVSKKCRALYKKEHNTKEEKEIKGTRQTDDIKALQKDIKDQKIKLVYLKRFLSLDNYDVISCNYITEEEHSNIVKFLEELEFSKEKIELIKNRIKKFNELVEANELANKVNALRDDLFTSEMFGLYESARNTIVDENIVYTKIKEQLALQIEMIDNILLKCVTGSETRDDTCEYLVMAFEDLRNSLKLCGPRLTRD